MDSKPGKKLAPEGFQIIQTLVEGLQSKKVDVISEKDFLIFLRISDKLDLPSASDLVDALAGVSLHQLLCDAFGVKFEAEERQEWLKARMAGIEKRNGWTDAIDAWMKANPEQVSSNYKQWIWSQVSDSLNVHLTGKPAKFWRDQLKCSQKELRNFWTDSHLYKIRDLELYAQKVVENSGLEPKLALKQAFSFYNFGQQSDFIK